MAFTPIQSSEKLFSQFIGDALHDVAAGMRASTTVKLVVHGPYVDVIPPNYLDAYKRRYILEDIRHVLVGIWDENISTRNRISVDFFPEYVVSVILADTDLRIDFHGMKDLRHTTELMFTYDSGPDRPHGQNEPVIHESVRRYKFLPTSLTMVISPHTGGHPSERPLKEPAYHSEDISVDSEVPQPTVGRIMGNEEAFNGDFFVAKESGTEVRTQEFNPFSRDGHQESIKRIRDLVAANRDMVSTETMDEVIARKEEELKEARAKSVVDAEAYIAEITNSITVVQDDIDIDEEIDLDALPNVSEVLSANTFEEVVLPADDGSVIAPPPMTTKRNTIVTDKLSDTDPISTKVTVK